MISYALAFLGYGRVARALAALLERQADALRVRFGAEYRVTGVATRRLGWLANGRGLDPASPAGDRCYDVDDWLLSARPDVVFETIALDPHAGQPALDYVRAALEAGAHVVSANKGPVVHGYRELAAIANRRVRAYRFESAVMDGAPVFSLARRCLPLAGIRLVSGLFTSTATVVLESIEQGGTVEDGVERAQALGIAEEDPAYDIDGWDTVVKLCAVAAVLFDHPLAPRQVEREGIRALHPEAVRRARRDGMPYRLVGRVGLTDGTSVAARVSPEQVPATGAFGAATGTTLVMRYDAPVFPGGLTVTSGAPGLETTAYGLFTDFLDVIGAT